MLDQRAKIKEVLPNATIADNSISIFAYVGKVTFEEMTKLLPLGFQNVKSSGSGITLTFKMTN